MEKKKEKRIFTIREQETFVAYSNELNKSLLLNLEKTVIIPYWLNTADEEEIQNTCKKEKMPNIIVSKSLDQEKIYLVPETGRNVTCVIQIEEKQITIEKLSQPLEEENNEEQPEM